DYLGNIKVNMIWVKASEAVSATVAYTITPKVKVTSTNGNWTVNTGELKEFTIPTNAKKFSVNLRAGEDAHGLNPAIFTTVVNGDVDESELKVTVETSSGNVQKDFLKLYKNTNKADAANLGEVAYAEFVGTLNLWAMREDKAYSGTIKFYDATGSHLKTTAITLTKVLPTTIPAGLTAKTGVIHADGSMPIYPKPQNGVGVFDLKEAFNISDGTNGTLNLVNDDKLEFNTESFTLADGTEIAKYSGRQIIEIASDRIGEDTKYPTTVTYDYGDIKYHPEGHGVEEPGNCIVEWATKFDIVLGCYVKDSKFAWHTEPSVVYAKETVIAGYDATTKKYVNFMTAKNPYLNAIDPFDADDTDWTTWAVALNKDNFGKGKFTVELWSNGDKERVNEFFEASIVEVDAKGNDTEVSGEAAVATALKLTKIPSATAVPENDVPTTVVFKFKDNFGHEEAIKALTFTMKKNAE
ncbi:MAG: hypothetical protein Q4P12_04235, partial [Bacteroidales bacterium]|nr:hypothetical protein [Bacteroidales bacterium]